MAKKKKEIPHPDHCWECDRYKYNRHDRCLDCPFASNIGYQLIVLDMIETTSIHKEHLPIIPIQNQARRRRT